MTRLVKSFKKLISTFSDRKIVKDMKIISGIFKEPNFFDYKLCLFTILYKNYEHKKNTVGRDACFAPALNSYICSIINLKKDSNGTICWNKKR